MEGLSPLRSYLGARASLAKGDHFGVLATPLGIERAAGVLALLRTSHPSIVAQSREATRVQKHLLPHKTLDDAENWYREAVTHGDPAISRNYRKAHHSMSQKLCV